MSDLKLEIKRLIIEALDLEDLAPEDIDDEMPLFGEGLALDSIDALELGVALRKKYQIKLDGGEAGIREAFRCVASLAEMVASRRQGA